MYFQTGVHCAARWLVRGNALSNVLSLECVLTSLSLSLSLSIYIYIWNACRICSLWFRSNVLSGNAVFLNTFLKYLIKSLAQGVREETEKVGEHCVWWSDTVYDDVTLCMMTWHWEGWWTGLYSRLQQESNSGFFGTRKILVLSKRICTVGFREIETTGFDPDSVFPSTHWRANNPASEFLPKENGSFYKWDLFSSFLRRLRNEKGKK